MGKVNSFKKLLRQFDYYTVKGSGNNPMMMKHDRNLGGIYVNLDNDFANIKVQGTTFTHQFENRRDLKIFLQKIEVNTQLNRMLSRDAISNILDSIIESEIDENSS
ncbi:MAG: hypothetical protein EAX96_01060 [Candidatus Lokiarchaeota archaeon]|nr:hypothetical protein [Candidatus Lokiarchaeota archaeon]